MTVSTGGRLDNLSNPSGRVSPRVLNALAVAGCTLFPPDAAAYCAEFDPAQSEVADLRNHSASISESFVLAELTTEDLDLETDDDIVLDSPNFTPKELEEFRARGFERRNRWG